MCFEVLGFDFMMDDTGRVYLLEVNYTPSFSTETPLDHLIKSNLIADTLKLMNVTTHARN
jgi:D-alanine-D-alanine ligase-like ATP-grasp enzyme